MKDLIYLEGAEGMEKLASYAVARNLIPFFGAGFSAGAEALNGSVPDCTAAQEYMKKALIEENPECADYLAELDFTGIAGEFYNDVSELKRARYFEDNFTDVKLGDNLKAFLHEIDWPYAYTINFDDGIEQSVPEETQNFALFCLIEDSASREVLFGCYINYTGTPNMNAAITGIRTERWTKISFLVRINICSPLQMRKTVTCSMH